MGKKKQIAALTVHPELTGKKVITLLQEELKISNRQIRKVISTKGLFLNGRPIHSESKVKAGDRLIVKLPVNEEVKVEPVPMDLTVIYEDDWLLAVNKETGLNVHNTKPEEPPALVNGVAYYFLEQKKMIAPRPVHRIDRDTSGVVLFAKSAGIQKELSQQWGTERVKKKYWALVEGEVRKGEVIKVPLNGKKACTTFSPLKTHKGYTELNVEILTGRTHQIRKHLKLIGHPILGDRLYHPYSKITVGRLALHAWVLELVHPRTGDKLVLEAPIPWADFTLPGKE
ncbi:MAG TPA: RluA family pseudouridine synthase [Firmicutes bacterium]|nr:RluA family pseudouridine synthase [Bacillota bacterium]